VPAPPPRSSPPLKALSFPFSSSLWFIHRTTISPLSCSAESSSEIALAQSQPAPDFNRKSSIAAFKII